MKIFAVIVRTLVVAAGFVWLWAWVALTVEDAIGQGDVRLPDWTQLPGLFVMTAGGALALACVGVFATIGEGTPAPFDPPLRFVAVGPYRYVRNPMYVGGALVLAGWALFRQSPAILALSVGWLVLFHFFVLVYEEPTLRRKFGLEYERYLERVPRWIP